MLRQVGQKRDMASLGQLMLQRLNAPTSAIVVPAGCIERVLDVQLSIRGSSDALSGLQRFVRNVQQTYQAEFVTFLNQTHHILKSANTPRLGQLFDPAGVVSQAAAINATASTITVLSYSDLLAERPPLLRDRASSKDASISGIPDC